VPATATARFRDLSFQNKPNHNVQAHEVDIVASECAPDGADKAQPLLEAFAVRAENATSQ